MTFPASLEASHGLDKLCWAVVFHMHAPTTSLDKLVKPSHISVPWSPRQSGSWIRLFTQVTATVKDFPRGGMESKAGSVVTQALSKAFFIPSYPFRGICFPCDPAEYPKHAISAGGESPVAGAALLG